MNQKQITVFSPGRINLIGEHVDYNDGFVLPAAIDLGIHFQFSLNGTEHLCRFKSEGFDQILEVDLRENLSPAYGWHNYFLGVLYGILKKSRGIRGFDCHITTKLPTGAGLSSSAALEGGLGFGINALFNLGLESWELARIGQQAEHDFVGTQCGIMDQFANIFGKTGHALLLDCQSLDYDYIPIDLGVYKLMLLHSGVTHELSESHYNTRRDESGSGLQILSERFQVEPSFRNFTLEHIVQCRTLLGELRYRRCRYVLEENARVKQMAETLKSNDLKTAGALLYASHTGQQFDYEVSCPELDFLVDFTRDKEAVLGARMMGGGFGGCTLNLIHKDAVERFTREITAAYAENHQKKLGVISIDLGAGTSMVSN